MNAAYGTDLSANQITLITTSTAVFRLLDRLQVRANLLRAALVSRHATRIAEDYDVVISADNEMSSGRRMIQYVHFPRLYTDTTLRPRHGPSRWVAAVYRWACVRAGRLTPGVVRNNLTLVNSRYIKAITDNYHGVSSTVLYPPACSRQSDRPWQQRDNAMLCVGRFVPEKRLIEIIDMVKLVRDHGHDVKLHIVGGADGSRYRDKVVQAAAASSWTILRENLPRTELDELASRCRYGIHAMHGEHFGMAVAEMQRCGCLVFAPNDGGCVEVLRDPALLYESVDDAVAKMLAVLDSATLQRALVAKQRKLSTAFSTQIFSERFSTCVRGFVEDASR